MFEFLVSIFGWFFGFWRKLPDKVKKKIVDFVVSSFAEIFSKYYRSYKIYHKKND